MSLDRTLSYRLHALHKLVDRGTQAAYSLHAGLPLSEARCLGAVGAFAPLSVQDLARRANLDKAQASRAAQALVAQALVRKEASSTDGRGVVLTLTRKGEAAWKRVMQVVERRNDEIFGVLTEAERRQFGRLLDRLLERARDDGKESSE
jgi:DNA-binding MarR family transcriptional regulator